MNENENAPSGEQKTGQAKLVRKAEAATARRRQSINRTLGRRGFEVIGEDVYARSGGKIELTATLRSQLENYLLRRVGRSGALAKRLGEYCAAEHLHLVSVIEEFDTPEDRKLREAFEASRRVPKPKESPIEVSHRYRVLVRTVEAVDSAQVLEVEALSEEHAEEICEDERDEWRNGKSSAKVRIIVEEHVVNSDLQSLRYETARLVGNG